MTVSLQLDLDFYRAAFEGEDLSGVYRGYACTSPAHLLGYLDWIESMPHFAERFPTDVFVFGRGEPEHRAATKIGGLPYRPAGKAWPVSREGQPMAFVGQLCFADSRDIVTCPFGDVAVIFFAEELWEPYVEWYPLGLSDLMAQAELPKLPQPSWPQLTLSGYRFRTFDGLTRERGVATDRDMFALDGTKVGGLPTCSASMFYQPPPGETDPGLDDYPAPVDTGFLGSLGSVMPELEHPYPWVNGPRVVPDSWINDSKIRDSMTISLGDMGHISLFAEPGEPPRTHQVFDCG